MMIRLSTAEPPQITLVGGKGASLIRLNQNGFDVPSGQVLTTDFFSPWIHQVVTSELWHTVLEMVAAHRTRVPNLEGRERLSQACDEVKRLAGGFSFSVDQQVALNQLKAEFEGVTFAVRSSSPEEDLAGASFAGLYETVLNANSGMLEEAVRTCFRSCLDARVLLYKREMQFENLTPAIAVIVQQQIESEISGVVFSLNPLTNDFDEALINANWGLGEALVSGEVTPDTVIVNKITGDVIENRIGNKGGDRSDEACLAVEQINELTETAKRIESLYGEPVDVEWTYSKGLHVLQARPITAYIPLVEEMQTEPGAPRNLYLDGALTDGLTISAPISPITLDTFEAVYRIMYGFILNLQEQTFDIRQSGQGFCGSRIYFNISLFLHLLGDAKRIAKQAETTNALMAEILTSTDLSRYRRNKPPAQFRIISMLRHLPGILWRMRPVFGLMLKPLVRRKQFQKTYDEALASFETWASQPIDHSKPLGGTVMEWYTQVGLTTIVSTAPALLIFLYLGTDRVKRLINSNSPEQVELADAVCRGYPDDQVVQMGLKMFDLAALIPPAEFTNLDVLLEKIGKRDLPEAFLSKWDAFISEFGCRGPLEMELANPGYGEAPQLALQQIAMISASTDSFNPHHAQRQLIEARESAYAELLKILPRRKRRRLTHAYQNIVRYSGSRELIKHHIMQVNERIRQRLLHTAQVFVAANRLDHIDQIFDLKMSDIDRATEDPDFDIRSAADVLGAPYRKLKKQVRHFPMAIDSRGRILRPTRKHDSTDLSGTGLSPGLVRGPVKVLNDPFEKEVLAGDILVAVTTDPGWTPLFINAAAVLLEIGGELQHGALVAREYGKPCVAGIPDITNRFHDGQIVEVDGSAGTVRIVEAI